MRLPRRDVLRLAAGAMLLPATARIASALDYPTRPVRIVVGYAAGLSPDIVGRVLAPALSDRLGQQVVIENRPGAGSNIATEFVVRAPADGYTLLMATASNAINTTLYPDLAFNFEHDIVPVAGLASAPYVMAVTATLPVKTVPEFIAYAKANPGRINMASAGTGTAPHIFGELFKMLAGVDLVHVPYRGNYFPDLLGGQVQVLFGPVITTIEHIRSGKLRGLAVTSRATLDALPGVPAMADFVPGYEASGWEGIGVPRGTSADIVAALNRGINACLDDPAMKARFAELDLLPMRMTPGEFGTFVADETDKWAKVIKFAGIKAE